MLMIHILHKFNLRDKFNMINDNQNYIIIFLYCDDVKSHHSAGDTGLQIELIVRMLNLVILLFIPAALQHILD